MQACLEDQLAQQRRRFDTQMQAERDEAQSRAQQVAERLGEQLDQKGQRINELGEQVQTQTETIEQTRLVLNRTRNELNEEKRKARQAIEETAKKRQLLEFVQQQCASLKEQLCHEKAKTRQSQTGTKEDSVERVECKQQ
jgi:hypothetical protein